MKDNKLKNYSTHTKKIGKNCLRKFNLGKRVMKNKKDNVHNFEKIKAQYTLDENK